uniref:3'(2'),5'-bisphosphate nucleotidase n=1 Tax=Apis cerana TaxID=7461 RepID=V9IE28_APICE
MQIQEMLQLKLPTHLEDIDPKDVCIWVDPLDGTSEYAQGLVEHVTVLVGVAIGHRAIGGVIHQPYYKNKENEILGRTLWGINGVGFGGFAPIAPPHGKIIVTTTSSHSNSNVQAAINALSPDEVLHVGGAGYKVIRII